MAGNMEGEVKWQYLLTKVSGSGNIFVKEGEVKWQWEHICWDICKVAVTKVRYKWQWGTYLLTKVR